MTRPALIRAATRSSPLARWQTEHVARLLASAHRGLVVEPIFVETLGDRTQAIGTPLHQIGGQGVFVKEVQAAVLRGGADIAVHSAKDLTSTTAEGLVLAAVPVRGDVRDLLVGATLATLPVGARVGSSSVRRVAQLRAVRPDLTFVSIRGNVGTRVARVGELDAVVVAAAGVERLGLIESLAAHHVLEWLPIEVMLPMVAQGALAVECRADDDTCRELLGVLTDPTTMARVTAERAFLARLGGGCELPVGALAWADGPVLAMDALIAAPDGSRIVRASARGLVADPVALGSTIAEDVLASGGRALLDAL